MANYFFIHIPKNGGMTIRRSDKLQIQIASKNTHKSELYSNMVVSTMNASGDHHGFEHARYRDIHEKYKMGDYKFFAVTRNPWARVASRFMFAKASIQLGKAHAPKDYCDVSSLDAFLEDRHNWGGKEYYWHRAIRGWYNALDHVCDDNDIVMCDMLRLEHLNEDCEKYFGIPEMSGPRNVTAIKYNYKDLYNEKSIQIVADWYKKDIEYWGYDFDTAATKNYWNTDASV